MKKSRSPTIMLMALLATATASTSCSKANAGKEQDAAVVDAGPVRRLVRVDPESVKRLGIHVEPAGTQAPHHRLHLPGTLDYNYAKYAEIGTLVEGRITSLNVGLGDIVKKGQVLATLLVPAVAKSQADFLSAQASAEVARTHAAREERLLEKDLTTAREAEAARAEKLRADAELGAARARLQAIGVGAPANNASIGGAGRLPLTASIAGIVVKRDAVLGRFLASNEVAFVIADLSELWATLQVHESDLGYMEAGADVEITVDAIPDQVFKGKLALVEPQVGRATRSASARVVVPNADGKLRPGLFVRAAVAIPALGTERPLIPTDAVQTLGNADVVFVQTGPGEFEVREVRIARRTAEVCEIGAGLQRNEPIAVTGTFLLRNEVISK